ncbi:hypothetical protein EXH44_07380 [Actinobacillus indolicus]|uniref:DUF4760 domain-containing protein n=1 Tax=Actinobacillus indolicus TaxID=51049 RepID=A0A4P7CL20_9PAST|nr:hypothetical protein [Actinobacillus indolicus]QBQ64057.1 hypothetical protein EXH44_07380 [Actinobacillus indolicus]
MKSILGLIVLLILLTFLYYVFSWGLNNPSVFIPLLTATFGFVGIMYTQYQSKSRDIRESHRASKIETYRMFFDLINLVQNNAKKKIDIDPLDESFQKSMQELSENLILWSSEEVLLVWKEFRAIKPNNEDPYLVLKIIDRLYRAIRKDLGHNDKLLKELDLIKMNITDPENIQ